LATAAGGAIVGYNSSGDEVPELQLEVAALQLQLQRREAEVQQLMTRERQLLSGEWRSCCRRLEGQRTSYSKKL
jgi:hypothetical protein